MSAAPPIEGRRSCPHCSAENSVCGEKLVCVELAVLRVLLSEVLAERLQLCIARAGTQRFEKQKIAFGQSSGAGLFCACGELAHAFEGFLGSLPLLVQHLVGAD